MMSRRNSGWWTWSHQILLLILFHFLPLMHGEPLAPALYVFGDSLFDSGNNNYLPTLAKSNFPPYGKDFPGRRPTGRFTNGRTVTDFIAEFLGLPYAPPYLSRANTLTGLNYASGSSGILPETGRQLGRCLNLATQINLFERTVESNLKRHFNSSDLSQYLAKSIFFVSTGNNDYLNIYSGGSIFNSSNEYTPERIATFLLDKLSVQFQRLYKLGARKIIMFELGPIGCTPSVAKPNPHWGPCYEESNQLVATFNNMLPQMLQKLGSTHPGSIFVLGKCNWVGYDAILHPAKYGIVDPNNACCLTWKNGTSMCIPFLPACSHAHQNFFWDGYHLTETAYSAIARLCINEYTVCTPYNMKQLVQI